MDVSAGSLLEAVVGPEGLRAVGGFYDFVWGFVWVGAGEGDVGGRVPVLGEEDVVEAGGERVDEREDFVAAVDGEGSARHEVWLEVYEEEGRGGLMDGHEMFS